MHWKQFLTPVSSIDWPEAEQMVTKRGSDNVVFLDVRQPGEYQAGHIPGSTLIPLAELDKRLNELSPEKPTVIY